MPDTIIYLWIIASIAIGALAEYQKKEFMYGAILSFCCSPVIGLILILTMKPKAV